jgi:hypothetical protein
MTWSLNPRSDKLPRRRTANPRLEGLEDRCVPDASPLMIPPGQTVFQFANSVLQNLESQRTQYNNSINALETQQLTQLQLSLGSLDRISQSLINQVTQDRVQFNTDIANGASFQTQLADLAKIQTDGQAAGAGVALVGQFKQAAINQTIGQIQADEQLRFAITQFINQTENSFLNQLLPAIVQAQQINSLTPQVGAPLTAGQSAQFAGMDTTTSTTGGATLVTQTTTTVTVNVGADGLTLTGAATAHSVTTLADVGQVISDETSTAGVINGRLQGVNSTAATGAFAFIFPNAGTQITPFAGFVGSTQFVGQFTDSMGDVTSFVLPRVS